MASVTLEIIEPYVRQGNDVIVNIKESVGGPGMRTKTNSLFLKLKDRANASDEQIEQIAMKKIWEYLEKMPDEP